MIILGNIVVSKEAPNTKSLWIDNGTIKYYTNGAWKVACEHKEDLSITEKISQLSGLLNTAEEKIAELQKKVSALEKNIG
jgi:hypothetical protein